MRIVNVPNVNQDILLTPTLKSANLTQKIVQNIRN